MSQGITVEEVIENLKKPSSMYIDTNWTLQRLLSILKSSINPSYNISVWSTDIKHLTTELTEVKNLTLYILGLETIEDIEEVKSMLYTIKDAIDLDLPGVNFTCKRKLNKAGYELYSTSANVQYESLDSVVTDMPEEMFKLAIPKHYHEVANPIIFLDEKYAELYDGIKLTKGTLRIDNIETISSYLPYYIP